MSSLIGVDHTWTLLAIMVVIAAFSIYLEQRYSWAGKLTGCVIALLIAMFFSNLRIIPVDAPAYDVIWDYAVPLAIPMLLFNANIKKIWRESGRTLAIYLIGSLGTVLGGFVAFFLMRNAIPELYKITAMMIGTYAGGSVNLVAMTSAFEASGDLASAAIVADNLLMALYFFVLVAIPASNFFLKKFKHPIVDKLEAEGGDVKNRAESYWQPKPISLKHIAFAVAVSFAIVAVSSEIAGFLKGVIPGGDVNNPRLGWDLLNGLLGNMYLVMTAITMLLATFLPNFMGNIAGAQEIGTFLIHIFFTVLGVPASIYLIITEAPLLLVFCAIIVLFNMIFSFGFGKLFKFNLEDICIASNANIGGPTTAAALAVSKGWNELIIPAVLVGTLGYVIGNYYGLLSGTFLAGF